MGTQRTSNKDLADKLDTLISILTAQAQAPAKPVPVETESDSIVKAGPLPMSQERKPKPAPVSVGDASVDAKYMTHMENKVSKLVASDGQERVIYLRRNLHGETKIAYCLKERWNNLRDNGLIGAVKVVS